MEPGAFLLVLWASTAIDLAVALVAVLGVPPWRRGTRVGLARVAGAVVVTAVAVLAKLAVLLGAGLDPGFGVIHLVFLDLVVVLPLVGVAVLVLRRGALRTRPVAGLALLALLAAPVGAYASFVEPFALRVERASVPVAPERGGTAPIRVGVLADIQTADVGRYERRAIDRLMQQRPDVIVIPGDLHQDEPAAFDREERELRALLARLHAPGGVYMVEGDVDELGELRRVTRGTTVQVLANRIARTRVRDRNVTIGGLRLSWETAGARRVTRALARRPGDDLRLLVSHRPDAADDPPAGPRIDLAIAGHTHGGQIQVPGFGPPLIASDVPRAVGAGGLHRMPGGPLLYVSRGVGVERGQAPRMRFGAPPEVSVLEVGG